MFTLRGSVDTTGLLNQLLLVHRCLNYFNKVLSILLTTLPGSIIDHRTSRHSLGVFHIAPHKEKAFLVILIFNFCTISSTTVFNGQH